MPPCSPRPVPLGSSPVLTIEAASRRDGGVSSDSMAPVVAPLTWCVQVYQCTAANGVGEPVTRRVTLRVLCKYMMAMV